jgi:hypothetical protein
MSALMLRLVPITALFAVLLAPAAASALTIEEAYLSDQEVGPLAIDDLDSQRGGFMTPLGFEVGFGAVLTATVDNAIVMQTQIQWTNNGIETTGATPVDTAAAAAGGIDLGPNASQLMGVVVPGDPTNGGGATAILSSLQSNGIANLILNTANGRNVTTNTQITLDLPQQQLSSMASDQIQSRIQDSLNLALRYAGIR